MKIKLLFILMIFAASTQAQVSKIILDSTVTSTGPDSQLVGKTIYSYDSKFNCILKEDYRWSEEQNDWVRSERYAYAYDPGGHMLLEEQYFWSADRNDWRPNVKCIYAYDLKGNKILEEWSEWSNVENIYVGFRKTNWTYGPGDHRRAYEYSEWSKTKNDWIKTSKMVEDFDSNGNDIFGETYQWSEAKNGWIGTSRLIRAYDSYKNMILSEYYRWSEEKTGWELTDKKVSAYDSKNNKLSEEIYQWPDTSDRLIGISKMIKAYDINRFPTLHEEYSWSKPANDWVLSAKASYSTDNTEVKSKTELLCQWSETANEWNKAYSKTTYSYTSSGNQMVWENSLWSEMDRNWRNHDKYIYAYDANNHLVWSESYYWPEAGGHNWIGIRKDISAYDDRGNITHREEYGWDKGMNYWWGVGNVTDIYNSNNEKISSESARWLGDRWRNTTKQIWDYDTNGRNLLWQSLTWSEEKGIWEGDSQIVTTYDSDGNTTWWQISRWSKEANAWITDYTTVYYYSEHTTTGMDHPVILQAQVYPNPVEDILHVQVSGQSTIQQLTIADMSGRIVCRAQPNSAIYQLNAHGWPKGIYVVTIITPTKTTVQKVIKQ